MENMGRNGRNGKNGKKWENGKNEKKWEKMKKWKKWEKKNGKNKKKRETVEIPQTCYSSTFKYYFAPDLFFLCLFSLYTIQIALVVGFEWSFSPFASRYLILSCEELFAYSSAVWSRVSALPLSTVFMASDLERLPLVKMNEHNQQLLWYPWVNDKYLTRTLRPICNIYTAVIVQFWI